MKKEEEMKYEIVLCNRCKKRLPHPLDDDYENDIAFFTLIHRNDVDKEGYDVETNYDLCWNCYNIFLEWIKNKK